MNVDVSTVSPAQDDDASLVVRILQGEPRLFEKLVRKYNQRLFRTARAQLGDDAAAEDVTQQAWLSIFRSLPQWSGRGSFSGWAMTIVINACTRMRGPMKETADESESEDVASVMPGPDEETHRVQLREVLRRNVDALPPKLRTVLVLRDVEGLSGPEVADTLAVTEEVVRVRLHRARRSLQSALETQFVDEGRELFAFMGSRCDAMTSSVMGALHLEDA